MQENKLDIYPSLIDNRSFRYLKIDNQYVASIIVYDYPKNISFIQVVEAFMKNYKYDISFYIQKMDKVQVLKELTYYISSLGSEIKTINKNQIDIDILNKQNQDSKKLRKDIQIKNEDVYRLNVIITFSEDKKDKLFKVMKEFQNQLFSNQIYSNITNFRNLDSYLLNIPINNYENKLLEKTYRNITSSALSNIFPFYTKTIFDQNGVIFGFTQNENKICNIDIFNNKYINSNMIIFGSSGSGKSYFTKTLIFKHYLKNITQYIFDPEGEYIKLTQELGAAVIKLSNTNVEHCYNIMQIYKFEAEGQNINLLNNKIQNVVDLICDLIKLKEPYKESLKEAIKKAYESYQISDNLESIYKKCEKNKIYINSEIRENDEFPTLKDVVKYIDNKELKDMLISKIINEYPFICNKTTIKSQPNIVVFDTSKLNEESLEIFTYHILNILDSVIRKNNSKKLIYFDEVWKYIRLNKKYDISYKIYTLYKSIRKCNAGIISITQDISDFFKFKKGSYGKSILNNASFKIFFRLDYCDKETLEKINFLGTTKVKEIYKLNKGNCILSFSNNVVNLNIKTNKFEERLIGSEYEDIISIR